MPTETVNRVTEFNLAKKHTQLKDAQFYMLPFFSEKEVRLNLINFLREGSKPAEFALIESILISEKQLTSSFVEVSSSSSPILYKVKEKDVDFDAATPNTTVAQLIGFLSFSEVSTKVQAILYKIKDVPSGFSIGGSGVVLVGIESSVTPLNLASHTQVILHKVKTKATGFTIIPEDKELTELEIDAELLLRKMKFLPMLHYGASHQTQELTEGVSKIYYMGLDGISQLSVAKWYPVLLGETTTYSFERYLTLGCVYKGVSEEAYDFRMWADLDKDASIDLYYGFNTTYSAPKGTKSLIATIKIPESREAAVTIPINTPTERLKHPGDKTMYVVTQVAVKPDAVGGLTGTLHIIWKEIM